MSLKAKLEAVIYAAEEPVTLTQLATLFAGEALEWKAAQQAAAAEQTAEVADPAQAPLPMGAIDPSLEYLGLAETPEVYSAVQAQVAMEADTAAAGDGTGAAPSEAAQPPAESASDAVPEAEAAPVGIPDAGSSTDTSAAAEPAAESEAAAEDAATPVDPEAEAKREARQRDRDVKGVLKHLLDELIAEYASDNRGVEIREIAGGYRMATKPECHDAVRLFVKSLKPPLKLSLPALETLAVVAYKQPVTAPEVSEIRGVESGGVLGSLLSRKLIATAGRKQVIGRPILYKTTKEFLLRFGLKDLNELPSMEEFEKMAAAEIEEMEPEAAAADAAEAAEEALLAENGPSGEELAGTEELLDPASPQDQAGEAPAEAAVADQQDPAQAEPASASVESATEESASPAPSEAATSGSLNDAETASAQQLASQESESETHAEKVHEER
ncbi:SMC-Scp complex subunit ScpB [Acidobacteria bacterium AB60]|nr:SMC-Scp complex subunit ScpB [Acidobacteria bacterium AB60]